MSVCDTDMSEYVYLSMSIYAGATPQGRPKSREYVLRKLQKKIWKQRREWEEEEEREGNWA